MAFLVDAVEIGTCCIGLADRATGEIHDVVAVGDDVLVEFSDAGMCPVAADHVENMA